MNCQPSYPLNSENASPPGTFKVYLSWADMALLPKGLTSAVAMTIDRRRLLPITSSSFVKLGRTRQDDGYCGTMPAVTSRINYTMVSGTVGGALISTASGYFLVFSYENFWPPTEASYMRPPLVAVMTATPLL